MKPVLLNWPLWAMLSLTLGLAPFVPEPHIWGKLRWIAGGARGMGAADWFDFVMHATPWAMLVVSGIYTLWSKKKGTS